MITMYMAISVDGYIAGPNGETPWSDEEWDAFQEFVASQDVIIMGRKTFEEMRADDDLEESVTYYVMTHSDLPDLPENVSQLKVSAIEDLPDAKNIGVIGGTAANTAMLNLGIVDKLILDIEPVMLGSGLALFGPVNNPPRLELETTRTIGTQTIQNTYKLLPASS